MKIDKSLAREAFAAGRKFGELFYKMQSALEKQLPPNIRLTWYECTELTLATEREAECYGDDTLFVFPARDDEKGKSLHLVVKSDGSVHLFYEKWYDKAKKSGK